MPSVAGPHEPSVASSVGLASASSSYPASPPRHPAGRAPVHGSPTAIAREVGHSFFALSLLDSIYSEPRGLLGKTVFRLCAGLKDELL